jgi:hypothetical protein
MVLGALGQKKSGTRCMHRASLIRPWLALCFLAWGSQSAAEEMGPASSPEFIRGYATAVLERAHSQVDFYVRVVGPELSVDFETKPDVPYDTILRGLLAIDGVEHAKIRVGGVLAMELRSPAMSVGSTDVPSPSTPNAIGAVTSETEESDEPGVQPVLTNTKERWEVFSFGELFEPLLADPRWPHFSASHLWYLSDDELERVGSATFGESFSFLRSPRGPSGQWEFGLQAGVFSVFDLEASSSDLVNADYLVGLTATHHLGDFTSMLRIYHQSSHLGDEFLLRNRVDRINLSFEVLDLLVSYDPWQWLRLYGGGGVIVHREPALDRGILQAGLELESPVAFAGGYLRPILASDFQFREESDWHEDVSVRGGVQIEHPFLRRTRLQILAEFYSGRSPNGQFYDRRIETIGLGIHLGI